MGKGDEKRVEGDVDFVKWFSELGNKDVLIAGGKGASLAEMYNAKVPVPPGFVVTAQAYQHFIKESKIGDEIKGVLKDLNVDDTTALNNASKKIREIIEKSDMPKEMEEEIFESYEMLDVEQGKDATGILEKSGEAFVAVRSSATTEDLVDASFAGQQDTFLNVRGKEDLLDKVKKCISSLFTARAIYYREKKGFEHDKAYLAVVVQKMINALKSGVMFSKNPVTQDDSIIIEAVWGLGEGIVSGKIKPDHYVVDGDLEKFKIKESAISKKKIAIVRNEEGHNETIKLEPEKSEKRVLDNYEIKRLAQHAKQLEEHYEKPQDIEFAIDKSGIYIVQSRPITTKFAGSDDKVEGNVLLSGLGASPGVASGVVRIVHELEDLEKVQKGDVLVTEMTNPDMVVSMQRAAAIVTDEGGVTSHAAIVSREMGMPAVVGTGEATKTLKDGDVVTVDGNSGRVIEGKGETKLVKIEPVVPTKTEVKVIVDLPDYAERAAKSEAKAVGLMRLEGIIASGGKHPMKFVDEKNMEGYVKLIADGVEKIAEHFEKVWIRTSDIRTDEFRNLEGASKEVEGNPMLGDHGVRFSLKHKEIMEAELKAVKRVAEKMTDKEIGVMMPQIISVDEVRKTKEIAKEVGIPANLKIGIMVETPAAVQIIDDLCDEGIAFISFGTNDLTQYTLAIDRNNEEVQNIYDETHPAVLRSMATVIRACKKKGVLTSICGQAGSKEPIVKFLIGEGIDSISVNADAARKVSELVAKLESGEGGGRGDEEKEGEKQVEESESGGSYRQVVEPEEKENGRGGIESKEESREEKIPVPAFSAAGEDIEDVILKELDDDYTPGGNGNRNEEVPSLNDAIPIESDLLEDEVSEKELEMDSEDGLGKEWDGEK